MADKAPSNREVQNSVFHGNPALVYDQVEPDGFWKSLPRDLKAAFGIVASGGAVDQVAKYASSLPLSDRFGNFLTKFMVNTLWGSLLHPPHSYKGAKFQHREADGGNNSFLFPELGKAGLPYAKTIAGQRAMPGARPDPGDLFDMLMSRDDPDNIKEGDLGISSMLLYHADLIIHDIFRTNANDKNISDTSSYLDLSPLYGRDRDHQEMVRTMRDGLLKPDSFAEDRLLSQPPGVCIYLIMYNRFHNYVAKELKEINENGKFTRVTQRRDEWLPAPDILAQILSKVYHANDRKGKSNKARPDSWNPSPATQDSIVIELFKDAREQKPGLIRSEWTIPFYDAKTNTFSDEQLDREWSDAIESSESKEAPPPGWLPPLDMPDFKEKLDAAWIDHVDTKIDEDIFQNARLVTCGLYINVAIHDYLRVLMRKHAENTSWTLDPRLEMSWLANKQGIERGIGNQVTVEFNVLYRFHSPLSKRDAQWTLDFLQKNTPLDHRPGGASPMALSQHDYDNAMIPLPVMKLMIAGMLKAGGTVEQKKQAPWIPARLPDFARDQTTGKFDDNELVAEMATVLQDPICQFGASNVPKFFRSIEILGILQSRKWEMATLNEFREFFGLSKHKTMADINSDPKIQDNLLSLYEHPDAVELYPGLFCEGQGRCLDPGVNCPKGQGTALWRGVFSDAVTLVRSDRFYTLDWNIDTLTGWGMAEVTPNVTIFKGGVMGRLFQRAFPGYFKDNSIHLWQPFYTAAMNLIVAYDQGLLGELQPVTDLGITQEYFEMVMKLKNQTGILHKSIKRFNDQLSLGLSDLDIADLHDTQKSLNDTYTKLSLLKKLTTSRAGDSGKLLTKLRFKLLKDKVKLKVERRTPPTLVSSYDTIKAEFLNPAKKSMYKNPGYTDSSCIPGVYLKQVLTGEGDIQDLGLATIQNLVDVKTAAYRNYYSALVDRKHGTTEPEGHKGDYADIFDDLLDGTDKGSGKPVTHTVQEMFLDYFFLMAHKIRHREQLRFQKDPIEGQIFQIDIVKDFAIPVITRFLADFLGFGHLIKTPQQLGRPYDENEIYTHFLNCQDYLSFDADETRAFRCRKAFQASVAFLKKLTEEGVADAQKGWFEGIRGRSYHIVGGDNAVVRELRKFGVESTQELTAKFKKEGKEKPQEAAAAVMLAAALEASHKSVTMFTSVMQLLLKSYPITGSDGKETSKRIYWEEIQELSATQTPASIKKISKWVLEAQRLSFNVPLVRKYVAEAGKAKSLDLNGSGNTTALKDGQEFLLEIHKASSSYNSNSKDLPPIDLTRDPADYLVYGHADKAPFDAKQLTIIAITALVRYAGTLKNLREAHDTMGRVKMAKTPKIGDEALDAYRTRFLTVKWDQLVPYPTTWNLRFDGLGRGVSRTKDNSETGNGIGAIMSQDESLSADGGSWSN